MRARIRGAGKRAAAKDHPAVYRATVVAGRAVVVILVAVVAICPPARGALTAFDPLSTFRQATSAERQATRPLAESVVRAYRSGRVSVLCAMFSPTEIKSAYGSVLRCRQSFERVKPRCSMRCSFRVHIVMTAYLTERDKARNRKTLAWLYVVHNPDVPGHGELEIRFRSEGRSWTLHEIVEARSG
jgi:hypothetical protein